MRIGFRKWKPEGEENLPVLNFLSEKTQVTGLVLLVMFFQKRQDSFQILITVKNIFLITIVLIRYLLISAINSIRKLVLISYGFTRQVFRLQLQLVDNILHPCKNTVSYTHLRAH